MPDLPYDPDRPHPFHKQAREHCSGPHDDAMPCEYCWMLERRLEPVSWMLQGVLEDASLTITVAAPPWVRRLVGAHCQIDQTTGEPRIRDNGGYHGTHRQPRP